MQRGEYDLAMVGVPLLPEPGLALAQMLMASGSRDAATAELAAIGKLPDAASRRARAIERASELRAGLSLVPLYASGAGLSTRAGLYGATTDATGIPSIPDLWEWSTR